jgi:non-homologous end joining protein Ku
MPNEYAQAIHELVQAKIEQRAPHVEIEGETREKTKVVNIMDALKKSMQARGQGKARDAVRHRLVKKEPAPEKTARTTKSAKSTAGARRSVH